MQYSQIVWATAYGALFFGETPDAFTVLGAAVVIGSGLYILFREGHSSETTPVRRSRARFETGTTPSIGPGTRHRASPVGLRPPPGRGGLVNRIAPE